MLSDKFCTVEFSGFGFLESSAAIASISTSWSDDTRRGTSIIVEAGYGGRKNFARAAETSPTRPMSQRYTVSLTTSAMVPPAAARTSWIDSRILMAWAPASPGANVSPPGVLAVSPLMKIRRAPACTSVACDNGAFRPSDSMFRLRNATASPG